MSMEIRDVTEADLPQIVDIENACFSLPWSEKLLRSQMTPGHLFLCAAGGDKVLGYVAYDDENYISMQGEKFYKWQYPLFMLGPIVGAVLYILFISFVKDNKQHRAEVERQLKERRAAKAAASAEGQTD